ncbi:hypothetical protein BCON_0739g00020 [Botryotinia convoluta]|uniref:Uncharacterized protein n=1 Tax=Botryotinia convoluta TaxID=54673 RepID=A0A4Z1H4I9_9HELO|nr:hypothetical protein BCON_0739g00020 [Botryotinia convoluta]
MASYMPRYVFIRLKVLTYNSPLQRLTRPTLWGIYIARSIVLRPIGKCTNGTLFCNRQIIIELSSDDAITPSTILNLRHKSKKNIMAGIRITGCTVS